jgi:hypothetical protein
MFLLPKWFAFGRQPSFVEKNAISRSPEKVGRAPTINFDGDAARGRREASSANSGAKSLIPYSDLGPSNAEDRYLGVPPVQLPVSAVAPPTPPRAPVEDTQRAHDDPADFDLPSAPQ